MVGPDKWGPHGWKFIHYITLAYPDNPTIEDKKRYKNFFISLAYVIPCPLCRSHYIDHLEKYPLNDQVLKNKEELMTWGIIIHNLVNKSNKKAEMSISNAMKLIRSNNDTCTIEPCTNTHSYPKILKNKYIVLLILIIFIYFICKLFKKIN